jgi:hypothetical protein
VTVEPTPAFLSAVDKLEHHRKCSLVREAAFRTDRAMPHGRKRAFDWVCNRYVVCGVPSTSAKPVS